MVEIKVSFVSQINNYLIENILFVVFRASGDLVLAERTRIGWKLYNEVFFCDAVGIYIKRFIPLIITITHNVQGIRRRNHTHTHPISETFLEVLLNICIAFSTTYL